MRIRQFFGNFLIAIGALNIINFWAPRPIPTVGLSAFIVGGLLIASGFLLKAPRDGTGRIRWDSLATIFKASSSKSGPPVGKIKPVAKSNDESAWIDPLLAVRVLRLAAEHGGRLSVAQTAMELDVSLDAAESALDECSRKGGAYMETDAKTGIPCYRFPEFEAADGSDLG
ncbi:MAG: hypothetical protein A2Z99_04845 [Treponema sp. GWB1_62_6]|nr:MAG: hypothetical protein A2Y36_10820 [Treponema sp. GWA1_62_8]OHE63952.1 MAG: hypothetical protein A2001_01975 [Treponema sp. GWC1_61_84]OHE67245.1 MAG: hypothetical protein A2Z99_04845 [Treponema sp. GWB1_62_6]OHE76712.1 MAG: hypothetical protein A2413_20285 [Treponema sp. RIFOXYC1_FULL_61_9]HCM25275.1 hypothetical protein [Treponema sp.]